MATANSRVHRHADDEIIQIDDNYADESDAREMLEERLLRGAEDGVVNNQNSINAAAIIEPDINLDAAAAAGYGPNNQDDDNQSNESGCCNKKCFLLWAAFLWRLGLFVLDFVLDIILIVKYDLTLNSGNYSAISKSDEIRKIIFLLLY